MKKLILLLTAFTCFFTASVLAETEPNDTWDLANDVSIGATETGSAGYGFEQDWWKVMLPADGKLTVNWTAINSRNIYCNIYDTLGVIQLASGFTAGSAVLNVDGLQKGTYYIQLRSFYAGDSTSYSFSPTYTAPLVTNDPEPNGTALQATVLPLNGGVTGLCNYYYNNSRDSSDWYRIAVNEDGRLAYTIRSHNGSNIYAELYDGDATTYLTGTFTSGITTKSMDGLAPGTYYIRLRAYNINNFIPYTLSDTLYVPAMPNDPIPNETFATASILPLNGVVTGHIGYAYNGNRDTVDYWKVQVIEDGKLNYTITSGNSQNIYAFLLDGDGITVLAGGYTPSTTSFSKDGLAPGTYYIKIYTYFINGFVPYTLSNTLDVPAPPNDSLPNETFVTGSTLPLNGAVTGHIGYAYNGNRDTVDFWKVEVVEDGKLSYTITSSNSQNIYAHLLDGDGTTVLAGGFTPSTTTYSKDGLAPGTYYIKIYTYFVNGFAPYLLSNTFLAPVQANDFGSNNVFTSATSLPLNGSGTGHIGYRYNGDVDTLDWFSLFIPVDGNISYTVTTHNSKNIYAELFDGNGSTYLTGNYTPSTATFSAYGLASGTYYLRIRTFYSYDFAPYTLSNTFSPAPLLNDIEPNNSVASAQVLPVNSTTTGHIGYEYNGQRDDTDFYSITLPEDGRLTCTISSNNSQNVYLNLYDHDGHTWLSGNYTTSTYNFSKNNLAAGTYYLKIYTYYINEYSQYTLSNVFEPMNFPAEPSADNSLAGSGTLLPANTPKTGHINFYYNLQYDHTDWWQIGYDGTGNMALQLEIEQDHFAASYPYYDYALYRDTTLAPIASGQVHSPTNTISLSSLSISKYFLKISPAYSTFGAYRLTASYTERCLTDVSISLASQQTGCLGTITYSLSNGLAPYTVQLYKDGNPYGSPDTASASITFSNLPLGSYYAKAYSFGGSGICNNISASQDFTAPADPTLTVTGPTTFCDGGSAVLTSSAANSYLWSSSETTQSISATTGGNYSVTIFDAYGCSASSTPVTITVLPTPAQPVITPDAPTTFCDGGSVNLSSSVENSYLWSSSETTQSILVSTGGSYSVTVTNVHGCSATSVPTVVTVNPNPTPSVSGVNVICEGSSTTLSASGGGTYLWNTTETTSSIIVTPVASTTYTVTVSNASNCSASATYHVTVNPQPAASISGQTTICSGNSTTLTANSGVSYSWNTGATTQDITVSPSTTTSYTVTVSYAGGCSSSTASTVTVNPVPSASITGNTFTCFGGGATLSSSSADSYTWSTAETTQSISVSPSVSTTYTVTVTYPSGCTTTANHTVTPSTEVIASCSVLSDVSCNGAQDGAVSVTASGGTAPYTLSGSPTTGLSGGTYTYIMTDVNGCTGTCSVTINEPIILDASCSLVSDVSCNGGNNGSASVLATGGTAPYTGDGLHTSLAAGTHTFTVTDANGCTATCSINISQPSALIASASAIDASCSVCADGSISIGAILGGLPPYSVSPSSPQTGLTPGTYCFTVTDANGCTTQACETVGYSGCSLSASCSTIANVSCNSGSDGIASVTSSGGSGTYSYLWSDGQTTATASGLQAGNYSVTVTDLTTSCSAGCSVIISEPSLLSAACSTLSDVSCNGGSDGSAMVSASGGTAPYSGDGLKSGLAAGSHTYTVTDANGCTAVCTVTISEPAMLVVAASATGTIPCSGGMANVDVTATGGVAPYTGTGSFNQAAGTTTYTVSDANGCTGTASVTLTGPTKVEGTTSSTPANCGVNDGTATVNASGGAGSYTYLWSDVGSQTTATATGLGVGTYTVIITDANGCTGTASATVGGAGGQPDPAGAIVGPPGACRNTCVVYSVAPVSGASSYAWTLPSGATGTSSTNSITVCFDNTYNGGFLCVTPQNSCGSGTNACINIPVITIKPTQPGFIVGNPNPCGSTVETYSIPPSMNATGYTWAVSGAGVAILSGQGTNSIQVSFPTGFGQGVIRVFASNCVGNTSTRSTTVTGIPTHSSPLTGPGNVCSGITSVLYSISAVIGAGSSYNWTTTGDITATGAQGSTSMTFDFGAGFTTGTISVATSSACGTFVRNYTIRSTPGQPGSMAGPGSNLCGQTGVTYSIAPIATATSYNWTVPAGVTMVTANGGTSMTLDFTPAFTGTGSICVSAMSACGSGIARCYSVTALTSPPSTPTGPASVCKSDASVAYTITPVAGATSYLWSISNWSSIIPLGTSALVNYNSASSTTAVITVNAENACGYSQPAKKTVSVNLGCRKAGTLSSTVDFGAYPNPTAGLLNLSFRAEKSAKYIVKLVDLLGNVVISDVISASEGSNLQELNLNNVAKGMYLLSIETEGAAAQTLRVVVE